MHDALLELAYLHAVALCLCVHVPVCCILTAVQHTSDTCHIAHVKRNCTHVAHALTPRYTQVVTLHRMSCEERCAHL